MINNPAVILVDVQNDFFTGPLKIKRVINIVEPMQRLVNAARKNEVPVIYTIDAHYPQDVEVVRKWGNHAIKGTEGAQVIPELKPDESKDYIVEKRTYSGFYETGLDPLLRSLYKGDGVKTVILRRRTHQHVHTSHFGRRFFPWLSNYNCQRQRGSVYS